jgi:phosphoribosylaminoimidazolecarboxamide formyltransferase/IMP cyclohydrolase
LKALLSVSDKTKLEHFSSSLNDLGYELYATSGTSNYLLQHGIKVKPLSEITGFSSMANGRVKTLNEKIFEMILNPKELDGEVFDLVVVNLYPFMKSIEKGEKEMIENFDIGGVALLRAAAKNFSRVTVISSPKQYEEFLNLYPLNIEERKMYAKKALKEVVKYDSNILLHLFNEPFQVVVESVKELRYGENPHQSAYVGKTEDPSLLDSIKVLKGKLSYNNYVDLISISRMSSGLGDKSVIVVKHTNPCGASVFTENIQQTFKRALSSDPKSAYGGVLCVNTEIDESLAKEIKPYFFDLIMARKISNEAFEILKRKKASIVEFSSHFSNKEWRILDGVALIQESDLGKPFEKLENVTSRKASEKEMNDVNFGLELVRHVKSNSVILVKNGMLIGLGAGQVSRVDAVKIAFDKAKEFGHDVKGSVMISDGFFPFSDSVKYGIEKGVRVFVEPGGSKRDEETIKACEDANVTLIFTHKRLFKH